MLIDDTKKTKHIRKTDQLNNEFPNTKHYSTLPVSYILVTLKQVFILFAIVLNVVIGLYGNFLFCMNLRWLWRWYPHTQYSSTL